MSKSTPMEDSSTITEYSVTDSPELFGDIPSLLKNIHIWIAAGTVNENLSNSIGTALEKAVDLYKKSTLYSSTTPNIESILLSWLSSKTIRATQYLELDIGVDKTREPVQYTEMMKTLFGPEVRYPFDLRGQVLGKVDNQTQCETAIIRTHDGIPTYDPRATCWICNKQLSDYKSYDDPNKKCRKQDSYPHCEHVLGIKLALMHLNLVHINAKTFNKNTQSYKDMVALEYDMSHACCNLIKGESAMITEVKKTDGKGKYKIWDINGQNIIAMLQKIKDESEGIDPKNRGCQCIGEVTGQKGRIMRDIVNKANVQRINDRMDTIVDEINAQVEHLTTLLGTDKYNAWVVYEYFIKLRFLFHIPPGQFNTLINQIVTNPIVSSALPPLQSVKILLPPAAASSSEASPTGIASFNLSPRKLSSEPVIKPMVELPPEPQPPLQFSSFGRERKPNSRYTGGAGELDIYNRSNSDNQYIWRTLVSRYEGNELYTKNAILLMCDDIGLGRDFCDQLFTKMDIDSVMDIFKIYIFKKLSYDDIDALGYSLLPVTPQESDRILQFLVHDTEQNIRNSEVLSRTSEVSPDISSDDSNRFTRTSPKPSIPPIKMGRYDSKNIYLGYKNYEIVVPIAQTNPPEYVLLKERQKIKDVTVMTSLTNDRGQVFYGFWDDENKAIPPFFRSIYQVYPSGELHIVGGKHRNKSKIKTKKSKKEKSMTKKRVKHTENKKSKRNYRSIKNKK